MPRYVIHAGEELVDEARVEQVLALRAAGVAIHHLAHQIRRQRARILDDILSKAQRLGKNLFGRVCQLREQVLDQRVVGAVGGAGCDEVQGLGGADEPGQEEGAAGLHDDAAAGEYEADLCATVGHANGHRQGHGDADTDCGALEGADDGLAALVDCERHLAASAHLTEYISAHCYTTGPKYPDTLAYTSDIIIREGGMVIEVPISVVVDALQAAAKANLQVGTGAEHLAVAREDDALDTVVGVKPGKSVHQLSAHRVRKGIVLAGAVEGDNDNRGRGRRGRRVVRNADVLVRQVAVGCRGRRPARILVGSHACLCILISDSRYDIWMQERGYTRRLERRGILRVHQDTYQATCACLYTSLKPPAQPKLPETGVTDKSRPTVLCPIARNRGSRAGYSLKAARAASAIQAAEPQSRRRRPSRATISAGTAALTPPARGTPVERYELYRNSLRRANDRARKQPRQRKLTLEISVSLAPPNQNFQLQPAMAPPTTQQPPAGAPQPLAQRFMLLAQTLQFGWFIGHLTLLLATLRYTISFIKFNTSTTAAVVSYRLGFLACAITYGIVVYKAYRARIRAAGANRVALQQHLMAMTGDENVQYLLMALIWLFTSPIYLALLPFTIYSTFHFLTYLRTALIPTLMPPPTTGPPPAKNSANMVSEVISKFVKSHYDTSMSIVANLELALWVRLLLGCLVFYNSWILLIIYTAFLRIRVAQSPFVRQGLTTAEGYVDGLVADPRAPPALRNVWASAKDGVRRFGEMTTFDPSKAPTARKAQ
ncbi:hypothetical protein Dda_1210 [Drechslerella dactyloides]|uniref:Uncharacterized protein n=1 Tax=Drechslerella dactyloides TaxID=74499 RepID=A0AAD6J696_DREDA|nr:hypothetical protein Dda_1210 [Drechslerella dactyloides]